VFAITQLTGILSHDVTVADVHAWLYQRVNRNIARVVPFNLAAALLIIGAGVVKGWVPPGGEAGGSGGSSPRASTVEA